jgi:hypothetical protein
LQGGLGRAIEVKRPIHVWTIWLLDWL